MSEKYFGVIWLIFFSLSAWADCKPRLDSIGTVSLNNGNPVIKTITVTRQNNQACQYFITFSSGNSANFDRFLERRSQHINYNIFKDAGLQTVLKDLPSALVTEVIVGEFTSGSANTHQVFLFRPDVFLGAGGTYRDNISVSVFEGAFGSTNRADATRNMRPQLVVQEEVMLSLVNTGANFNAQDVTQSLDFGTLQSGESLSFDLMVQSNAGFEIAMSSQNDGQLKHTSQNSIVPYVLSVNGETKSLSNSDTVPVVVASGSGSTPAGGARHAVRVEVGSINNKMSGLYQDNITVTVTTTD